MGEQKKSSGGTKKYGRNKRKYGEGPNDGHKKNRGYGPQGAPRTLPGFIIDSSSSRHDVVAFVCRKDLPHLATEFVDTARSMSRENPRLSDYRGLADECSRQLFSHLRDRVHVLPTR